MRRDRLIATALFGGCVALYVWTLCPGVYVEGSGELIGASWWLGTAHPTGYPLYTLLARVLGMLAPVTSPARAVNLATALLAAAAAPALFGLLRRQGLRVSASLAAALALACGQTFWSQAVIAEVYGLFVLAALLLLWVSLEARRADGERPRWLLLAGYVSGLAATCHLQAVLLLPWTAAAALWPCNRLNGDRLNGDRLNRGHRLSQLPRDGALFGLGGVAGVSVLLYLIVRNDVGPGFHWGPLDTPTQLWDHITGALYRSSFLWLPWPALAAALARLGAQLTCEWPVLLLPFMGWGIGAGLRRHRALTTIVLGAMSLNLVAGLTYHRDPAGLSVFFLLTIASACVLLGIGLDDVERRLQGRLTQGAALLSVVCAAVVPWTNLASADRSDASFPDTYGRRILDELPPGAILFTDGDDASYIVDYLHRIEAVRPDVQIFQRMGRGTDLATGPQNGRTLRRRRAEVNLIRSGEAVHFLVPRQLPADEYAFEPFGLTYRAVVRPGSAGPAAFQDPTALLATGESFDDPWVAKLAANCWYMKAEYLRAMSDTTAAVAAYRYAASLAPGSLSTNYNVSLNLLQLNRIEQAEEFALQAMAADPLRRGPYRLAAAILARLGRSQEAANVHKKAGVWAVVP